MKKLFAAIFAWALFSTQVFAQTNDQTEIKEVSKACPEIIQLAHPDNEDHLSKHGFTVTERTSDTVKIFGEFEYPSIADTSSGFCVYNPAKKLWLEMTVLIKEDRVIFASEGCVEKFSISTCEGTGTYKCERLSFSCNK